ncbi:MAG: NTP transferase domain-containing protein, partial [Polyangiaceae bacterium]
PGHSSPDLSRGERASSEEGPRVNAVITAGGLVGGDFARTIGTEVEALAPLGRTTLLERAIDAARGAGAEQIAVVGGDDVRDRCRACVERVIEASSDGGENALLALASWESGPLLYLTSDLPFITARAVREFLERSSPFALTMPLADADAYEARFPQAPEHVVELGGERVANGNIFFIAPAALAPLRHWAVRFFEARKNKLAMARMLGPSLLFRFLLRKLTIGAIERKAARGLGVSVAAIRGADPAVCYDVDTLEEYTYALEHLRKRALS